MRAAVQAAVRRQVAALRAAAGARGKQQAGGSGASGSPSFWSAAASLAGAAAVLAAMDGPSPLSTSSCVAAAPSSTASSTSASSSLPVYTRAEVAKHKSAATRIWVTYKDGVFDVTDFVAVHPGGNKILLAAGGAVDPYWVVYQQHNHPHVHELLEKYRIGRLDASEAAAMAAAVASTSDPYAKDPARHPALQPRSVKPFNAEPPASLLVDSYITPTELFFVRNHLPVPHIDESSYRLEISGPGVGPDGCGKVSLSLDELKTLFPPVTVVAAMQCAGNRRADMGARATRGVRGLGWDVGAIGNVEWRGARLRDVLAWAGVGEAAIAAGEVKHLQFEGLDTDPAAGTCYAASVPADFAIDPTGDALLAYEMNGAPILPDHGSPVRAVIPGLVGARQVKWLGRIIASPEEASSIWQVKDYKAFPPTMDWDSVDYASMPAIQDMPVASAVCEPAEGAVLPAGTKEVTVKGWAWSGGGRAITRVDVSVDGGKTWTVADVTAAPEDASPSRTRSWGWTLWRADVPLPPAVAAAGGETEIVCRAMDISCNTQPEHPESVWNFRGLVNNAWHRVRVTAEAPAKPQQQ